jgi:hypothetical protein
MGIWLGMERYTKSKAEVSVGTSENALLDD